MKAKSIAAVTTDRSGSTPLLGNFPVLAALATLLLAPAAAQAADPEGSKGAGKSPVVTLEKVPGSAVPRVILAAKAAERLGIEIGKVGEETVVRRQMVSGLIIPPMERQPESRPTGGDFGGFGKVATVAAPLRTAAAAPTPQPPVAPRVTLPPSGDVWVLVTLSPGEWDRLAKDKPARLLPLATREDSGRELLAKPNGAEPVEDVKRSMLSLYYVVPGKDHGLAVSNRMRVELQLSGGDEKQKVVPYSAVYYDAKGAAWVYVNTKPLTYERQRITVERVVGNQALLSDGPSVGTTVVTVGAALLYGAEIFKK